MSNVFIITSPKKFRLGGATLQRRGQNVDSQCTSHEQPVHYPSNMSARHNEGGKPKQKKHPGRRSSLTIVGRDPNETDLMDFHRQTLTVFFSTASKYSLDGRTVRLVSFFWPSRVSAPQILMYNACVCSSAITPTPRQAASPLGQPPTLTLTYADVENGTGERWVAGSFALTSSPTSSRIEIVFSQSSSNPPFVVE